MSSKFVAYNSSKEALNMQSAVLANSCASSHSKTGMRFACHLSSLPRGLNLPIEHLAAYSHQHHAGRAARQQCSTHA